MTFPILPIWANGTNYPAGALPWSGLSTNTAPAYTFMTPEAVVAAQELNSMFNTRDTFANNLLQWQGGIQYRPIYQAQGFAVPGTWSAYDAVAFDPTTYKWLVAGTVAGSGYARVITGRGAEAWDWVSFNAQTTQAGVVPLSVCRGIEPSLSPPNKIVYVGGFDGSNAGHLLKYDTSANTFADVALADNANVTDVQVMSVSGSVLVLTGATSSADCHIKHTVNQGSSFVNDFSFSVPVGGWLMAQTVVGGGTVMAISTNAGGSNSGGGGLDVYTTTNGTSWTHTNVTGIGLGGTEIPTALCWGADAAGVGCWILQTFVGGIYATYRSYNSTVWAAIFTSNISGLIGAGGGNVQGMAAIGSAFVAVVNETPNARLIYSFDGGINWQLSDSTLVNTGTGTCRLAGGPTGFMALSHTWLAKSFSYGLSGSLGTV